MKTRAGAATCMWLLLAAGCASVAERPDPDLTAQTQDSGADQVKLDGGRTSSGEATYSYASVSEARRRIVGHWVRRYHGRERYYPITPGPREITSREDGTFTAMYAGLELTRLRQYTRDESLGPEVNGEFKIMGRSLLHDFGLTPVAI